MSTGRFRLLVRHFVGALLAPDILTDAGVDYLRRTLFGLLAILLVAGIFVPRLFFKKYTDLGGAFDAEPYLRALQADTLFMLAVPMVAIAFAAVLAAPLLFPDETDYRVLTPLPISRTELFAAKLTAVILVMVAAVVAVNLIATWWFPVAVGGKRAEHTVVARIAAHAVASVGASLFAAVAVMAVQGVMLTMLPRALQRRVAPMVQGGIAVTLCLSLPLVVRMPGMVVNEATVLMPPLAWLPPAWFLGLERWLLDGSAAGRYADAGVIAIAALTIAIAAVGASYALLYRSAERLAGVAGSERRSMQHPSIITTLAARAPLPPQTLAIVDFVASGLARSRLHQFVFVLAMSGGVAILLGEIAAVAEGASPFAARPQAQVQAVVAAPLLIALTVALGLRAAYRWPLDRHASWLFRVTDQPRTRTAVLDGASLCLTTATCGAALLTAVMLQPPVLGHTWLPIVVLTVLAVLVLVEYLLADWNRVPFACSYLPGKHLLAYDLGVFAARYFVLVVIGGNLIRWSALAPARTVACAGLLLAIWASLRRMRWRDWGARELDFEDDDPAEPNRLKIGI